MREDPQLDAWIRVQARGYREPPATPKEELWTRIRAERARREAERDRPTVVPLSSRRRRFGLVSWAAGIAAILGIGLGLGWVAFGPGTARVPQTPPGLQPGMNTPTSRSVALGLATIQHLSRVETFLTGFRSSETDANAATRFPTMARELLTSTRLLIDVPDLDPKFRDLLLDLEQVLVQITQLAEDHPTSDLDLITDGLEQQQVLPRLRRAIPAGAATRVTGAS